MGRSATFRLLFLLLFGLLSAVSAPAAGDLKENRRQLEEIQRRINETARTLEEKQAAARTLRDDLRTVTREEARLRERIKVLQREAAGLQTRLAAKEAQLQDLQAQSARTEELVRKRLVALYKGGQGGPLRLLFAAGSPARITEDYDYFGRIVRRDRQLLNDYRQQLTELEEARRHLAELQQQRQGALADLQGDQRELRRTVRLKEQLLARTRQEENALSDQLAELKERAARLGGLIKKLESAKTREYTQLTGAFASQKGHLPWPVAGRIRIGFGTSRHPDLGTLHDSQGIEIEISGEQPVAAVWPGQVIFADWFKGFGNLLILDHGEGFYTLYAQASRLTKRVGEQVKGGEVVAFSGYEEGRGALFRDPAPRRSPRPGAVARQPLNLTGDRRKTDAQRKTSDSLHPDAGAGSARLDCHFPAR